MIKSVCTSAQADQSLINARRNDVSMTTHIASIEDAVCLSVQFAFQTFLLSPDYYTVKPVLSGHSKRTQKLVLRTDYILMQVKSIAECSKESILQFFWPSLSYHFSFRHSFCLCLSGRLRQVLLYVRHGSCTLSIIISILTRVSSLHEFY